jgi:hypothetical protein
MAYKYVAVFNAEETFSTHRSHEENPFSLGLGGTVVWNGRFLMRATAR